jgi:hypothetical protein
MDVDTRNEPRIDCVALATRLKERYPMQFFPQSAVDSLHHAAAAEAQAGIREDRAYQAVTVAAILLFFASLWVF